MQKRKHPHRTSRAVREQTPAAGSPRRDISIAIRHPRLRVDRRALAAAIALLDSNAPSFRGGCPPGELSIAFVTDPELALLHDEFLDDPAPTDVITFPGDPAHGIAGEICISADAARRQAGPLQPTVFARELMLYVVHGWLHLAGYDDLQPARKRVMRRAEARAMRLLEKAGTKPRFRLKAITGSRRRLGLKRTTPLQLGQA